MAGKFYYGWIIAVGCTLVTLVNGGIFYTFTVFFKPVAADFAWTRGEFASSYSIMLLAYAPGAFFAGRLADRHGPRVILLIAGLLIGLGFIGCSRVNSLAFLVLSYALIGLGLGATLALPTATIQRWFVRFRAAMVGVVNAGNGIGGLIFAPLANYLIASYGWRSSYLMVGLIFGGVVAVAAAFLVAEPRLKGLVPYGDADSRLPATIPVPEVPAPSFSLSRAFRLRAFWGMAALCVFTFSPAFFVTAHIVPYITDREISAAVAAQGLGMMTAISVIARLGMSWAAGKIGWMRALSICYFVASGSVVGLVFVTGIESFYVFVVFYGLSWGSTLALIGGATGHFFGLSALSELLGFLLGVGVLIAAVVPWLGGVIFDLTSSYTIAIALAATFYATAGFISLALKPPKL